jgi:hypothetical protein
MKGTEINISDFPTEEQQEHLQFWSEIRFKVHFRSFKASEIHFKRLQNLKDILCYRNSICKRKKRR